MKNLANLKSGLLKSALLFGSGLILCVGCSSSSNDYVQPPPPSVTTAKPIRQDITLFLEKNGETEPVEQADVRSRVRGFVQSIQFDPGRRVEIGDVLYEIEPDQYLAEKASADAAVDSAKAAISVARASKVSAVATLDKENNSLKRQKQLIDTNSTSQSDYEAALAMQASAAAAMGAAEAQIESMTAKLKQAEAIQANALLNLQYTQVRAPIAGDITRTLVKKGNLVENGTHLATVIDQDSIFANFSIDDRTLLELKKTRRLENKEKMLPDEWKNFSIFLQRETDQDRWFEGRLDYLSQEGIDAATGTFLMRAIFDNNQNELMPGMFVRVRIPVEQKMNAILVPQRTVVRDQRGTFVMVVGTDNKVERREVTLGQQLDSWAVVEQGLEITDSIVVDGLQRARPGSEVNPTETILSTEGSPLLQASITPPDDDGTPNSGQQE